MFFNSTHKPISLLSQEPLPHNLLQLTLTLLCITVRPTDIILLKTIAKFFHQYLASCRTLATDTDIPKFACRYFNKVFSLKLVWIAYTAPTCCSL